MSWSTSASPTFSMSICPRPQNHFSRSRNCAGHSGFTQRMYGVSSSFSTLQWHDGHSAGGVTGFAPFGRSSATTWLTYGMTSPAFSTTTVSP